MEHEQRPDGTRDQYDVERVRAGIPALAEGFAHLDGPGGTQVPAVVAHAVAATFRAAVSNRGGAFAPSRRAEEIVDGARAAVADLVGGQPEGVVLGSSMTSVTYVLANALAKGWGPGDEVVVSRLDHDANGRPWVQAAERAGATVRWIDVDPATCTLTDVSDALSERTRLVAVTGASNLVGTRPDVRAVADAAHAVGALVAVDGVHLTPHAPVDVAALGADIYALSAYKLCGPHLGAAVAAPELLDGLRPDKLVPSSDAVPSRFEHGTPPFELLAGLTAAVDWVAALLDPPGETSPGSRRERVLRSMAAVEAHEDVLLARLLAGLAELPVATFGAAPSRTPTVAFRVEGRSPREVAEHLGSRGVCVGDGDFYARELALVLGLQTGGGVVRAGLAPYSDATDVDRLLAGLAELA
ncbi:MAG: cysteine desulfurase-like protein [Motilibacteraceae bacterium]